MQIYKCRFEMQGVMHTDYASRLIIYFKSVHLYYIHYRFNHGTYLHAYSSTGTRKTISDKYALSGNGNLVENTKRET